MRNARKKQHGQRISRMQSSEKPPATLEQEHHHTTTPEQQDAQAQKSESWKHWWEWCWATQSVEGQSNSGGRHSKKHHLRCQRHRKSDGRIPQNGRRGPHGRSMPVRRNSFSAQSSNTRSSGAEKPSTERHHRSRTCTYR